MIKKYYKSLSKTQKWILYAGFALIAIFTLIHNPLSGYYGSFGGDRYTKAPLGESRSNNYGYLQLGMMRTYLSFVIATIILTGAAVHLIRLGNVPHLETSLPFADDELFYEEVAKELETNSIKTGLWTKALAEAGTDNERVKPIYIRLRVAQLLAAKEAELRELQRLEDERIRDEEIAAKKETARAEEARQEAVRMEAAELVRKEREAEAELEKRRQLKEQQRKEEQRRLKEQKQESEKMRRNGEEEEAAKDPTQTRKMADQRMNKDMESLACYHTRISKGETYYYHFKQCTFNVSSGEILFIPEACKDMPSEILVSRKLGDYIEMALGIWEPGVTGIIHLKDGTKFRLNLDTKSKKALKEWMEM
jgi:hypothetical protein